MALSVDALRVMLSLILLFALIHRFSVLLLAFNLTFHQYPFCTIVPLKLSLNKTSSWVKSCFIVFLPFAFKVPYIFYYRMRLLCNMNMLNCFLPIMFFHKKSFSTTL